MNAPVRSPMLEAALAYAARGWPVFPCDPHPEKPRSKRPLVPKDRDGEGREIEGSGGLKKATTDEAIIRAWWRKWPDALIGVVPGQVGAFVADLDPKGETVEDVEARLVAAIGAPLPAAPRVRTQSGGVHIWFRRPDRDHVGNETPGLQNIDIRCDNGYVIVPPSTMRNGRVYSWIEVEAAPAELPEVPAALLALIDARRRHDHERAGRPAEDRPRQVRSTRAETPGEAAKRRYATVALDNIRAEIASTSAKRGSALFAGACSAGRLVAAGVVSEREAEAILLDAADACGLLKDDGLKRVEREIANGLAEGRNDALATIARLDEIATEAEERARRYGRRERGSGSPATARAPEPPPHPGEDDEDEDPEPEGRAGNDDDEDAEDDDGEPGTSGETLRSSDLPLDLAVVEACAKLDHSDTDNGERLIRHFGRDILVLAQDEIAAGVYLGWNGSHWDFAGGRALVERIAQHLGDRIGLEAEYLGYTPDEQRAIDACTDIPNPDGIDIGSAPRRWKERLKRRKKAIDGLERRKRARRAFGVTSKNKGRIFAALDMIGPRVRRDPDAFNFDQLVFACRTHTLRFLREIDDECPDPAVTRYKVRLVVHRGHRREDMLTAVVPLDWRGLDAPAPRWRAFLAEMLTDPEKRRTVQQFAGTGLLGVVMQYLMFHYGTGANGKSVFLETLTRALGQLAVGLPRESIVGTGDRGVGAASPDLVRLYGRRMARILEVKADVPLQDDLVKKLTGGEKFPVRSLFKGYFEFLNIATAHMSGNGFPTIDGADYGMMRRLLVVHWDQTVAEDRRRDFEEMVGAFIRDEGPGILAWLVEGALDYLANGLYIAPAIKAATQQYSADMNPIGEFMAACVRAAPKLRVQAADVVAAYHAWCDANGLKARSSVKLGKQMAQRFTRAEISGRHYYMDCELHDVPESAPATRLGDS